ncbi:hypothetical protein [Belliella pelovolcani]|uniref:hypothetical protein n=1 Tax=Belliella pelovolcani TaxID=529505 RepID=UPI00391D8164
MKKQQKKISDKEWLERDFKIKKKGDITFTVLSLSFGLLILCISAYYHLIVAPNRLSNTIHGHQYWIYIFSLATSGIALLFNALMKIGDIRRKYF